jgi:hypothetical protein
MADFAPLTPETQALRKAFKSIKEKSTNLSKIFFTLFHQNLALRSYLYTTSKENSVLKNVISIQSSRRQDLLLEKQQFVKLYIDNWSSSLVLKGYNAVLSDKNTILRNQNASLHQQNNALCAIMMVVLAFLLVYLNSLLFESAQSLPCI